MLAGVALRAHPDDEQPEECDEHEGNQTEGENHLDEAEGPPRIYPDDHAKQRDLGAEDANLTGEARELKGGGIGKHDAFPLFLEAKLHQRRESLAIADLTGWQECDQPIKLDRFPTLLIGDGGVGRNLVGGCRREVGYGRRIGRVGVFKRDVAKFQQRLGWDEVGIGGDRDA